MSAPHAPPPADQRVLLTHAVLVGLTPLIPVPFVDDWVKRSVERRLVRSLANNHGHPLLTRDVDALIEEEGGSLLWAIGKGIVMFPVQLVFRKLLLVLEVKRASDEASRAYHRGLLLDAVLRSRVLAPQGRHTAAEVRTAIEAVVREASVSPLERAIGAVFEGSRIGLGAVGRGLLKAIGRRATPKRAAAAVEATVSAAEGSAREGAAHEEHTLRGLVDRLVEAVQEVPDAHFEALEQQLEARLGVPLRRASKSTRA